MTREADVVLVLLALVHEKARHIALSDKIIPLLAQSRDLGSLKLLSSYVVSIPDRNLFLEPLLVTVLHTASCHGCPGPYPRYYLSNIQEECPPSHIITNDIDVKAPRRADFGSDPRSGDCSLTRSQILFSLSSFLSIIFVISFELCGRTDSPTNQNVVRSRSTLGRCDPRDPGVGIRLDGTARSKRQPRQP